MTEQESRRGKSRRERVEFARSRDILDVANELQMELVRSGRDYRWKEHDSLVISPDKNLWKWFSRNTGGDAISLVETIKEVSFNQSVDFLNDGNFKEFQMVERPQEDFKYYLEKYEQPFSAGRDYLRNQRGLSDETIDYFLEQGVLAQANAKLDYFAEGNSGSSTNAIEPVIVFKSLSSSGEVVGASLQGIQENWEKWSKHGYAKVIMKNSDPMTGIHVDIGSPKRLIFTESPIDLMSYYELHKDSLQDVRLVSMDGLKESTIGRHLSQIQAEISGQSLRWTPEQMADGLQVAIDHHFFEDGKNADLITLALDNDKAGRTFIQELEAKGAVINSDLPGLRPGQDKTDWNDVLKSQHEEKSDSRKSEYEEMAEATLSESSHFPDTSHLSPEDATWLKENWNNISFSVQSTRPSETDPTTEEKHISGHQDSIANTEENAGRMMSYEEVKRENEALTKKLNNRVQSGELSIEFAPDFYLYDVFAKLGNSHPTKYLNDKRMEVLSPIHSLLTSIDDQTIDLYKKKGTPEQDSLYQALKPHQRTLGVDISTQFIGELAIAAYNTNKQIESLSRDSFGVYFGERTLENLSQSIERMLEYPLIELGKRDFTYGFVVTPNTLFHYLEDQEGEVILNHELLDNLMSLLDTHPIKIIEVPEEKEKSLDNYQETNTGGELLNRNSSSLGVETPGTAPQPVEKNSQPDFPANVRLHFTIDEDRMSNKKFRKNMRTLNLYANAMRDSAQWYLKEMSGTSIHYVYRNPEEKQFQILNVKFDKKNWMHLTGVTPVYNEWVEHLSESFVEDVAAGKGHFKDLKFANGMSDKLKVLNLLPEVIESDSFVFNDLSSVKKFNNLDLSKAIRPEDTDLLLLFKEKEFTHVPASLMRVKGDLSKQLEDIDTGTILGVYRERDGQIEQLSINDEYVKDGGEEMLSVLRNKQYEEVPKESEQTTSVNTIDKTSLDSVTFTQVLDTVYNLGVPDDISKTPEEFHQAWNQYLDYAKQYNDKFDQIVAAAGEDHLLDTNSDFYREWKQDYIYKENYHVRLQWSEERPEGPILPFKETELISYQEFARELYKANQSFYQLHQEGIKQVTGGHPEGYISPTKIQFSIYAPDGELIQDGIRYDIGNEINPIAHKERLGTREMREHPELMKIDGTIFTPYHLERLASELDISQFSYALEDTPYADQLLSRLPYGDLENSPIGFTDSSHDARLGFISFDGMDSVEVENLSAWFEKLGVKDSPMEQVALVEKWQKEIKSLSEKVEQTIATVREEFEKSQEEEIKLEEQGHNKQELKRDADADGVSDEEELLQGTNPYDFRSKPGSKPEGEESLQEDEVVLAAGSLAVADFIQNKDMAGLSRHLKEGIKEFLDSDKYKDYLTKMSQLNNYSNRNLRLILAQNPEARQVASFKQWKENFGRYVKKGEKALRIFKPMTKIKKDENNQPILDKNGKPETVTFFGLVPVFDVSQTEGKEMPKAAEVKEQLTDLDYANLYRALMAIAKENDVSVRFEEMENNKHGYYSVPENQIVLRSNEMNKAQIIKTFLHEMAHAELHHADNPQKENLTRSTAELQAESVAYVVSSYYGIDTSEYSFNYLSGWSADKETLADLEAQLDIVQQEAKSLMVRMDQALEQLRLSQEKQTKRSFEQKLERFKDQGKQAVEEHKQELKADAQSKKEKGFSK